MLRPVLHAALEKFNDQLIEIRVVACECQSEDPRRFRWYRLGFRVGENLLQQVD